MSDWERDKKKLWIILAILVLLSAFTTLVMRVVGAPGSPATLQDGGSGKTVVGAVAAGVGAGSALSAVDVFPTSHRVRLVVVHHSTGENWLADENGGLDSALRNNNYYVSDTNYGWGPGSISAAGSRPGCQRAVVQRLAGERLAGARAIPERGGV